MGLLQYGRNLVVGEAGNHGRHQNGHRNPRRGQGFHGLEPAARLRRPRLHPAGELAVKRRYRHDHARAADLRELRENVGVAGDESAFGDDPDGISKLKEDLETFSRYSEAPLRGLVAVRDPAYRHGLGSPPGRGELRPQKLRRVFLDEYLRLEVEPGRQSQVLVRRPRVAVHAPVLAAPVGIHARAERHVGAVVSRNYPLRVVPVVDGVGSGRRGVRAVVRRGELYSLEPARGVCGRSPPLRGRSFRASFQVLLPEPKKPRSGVGRPGAFLEPSARPRGFSLCSSAPVRPQARSPFSERRSS